MKIWWLPCSSIIPNALLVHCHLCHHFHCIGFRWECVGHPWLSFVRSYWQTSRCSDCSCGGTETLLFCSRRLIPACLVFGIHTVAVLQNRQNIGNCLKSSQDISREKNCCKNLATFLTWHVQSFTNNFCSIPNNDGRHWWQYAKQIHVEIQIQIQIQIQTASPFKFRIHNNGSHPRVTCAAEPTVNWYERYSTG